MNLSELSLFSSSEDRSHDDDRRGHKADGAYRTISEVAAELNLPQHVLRFWETKFKQISPMKRGGGRRYYRPQDTELLRRIHYLLHTQGYTIKGVQKLLLKDRNLQHSVPTLLDGDAARVSVDSVLQNKPDVQAIPTTRQTDLQQLLDRLKDMRSHIDERC